MDVAGLTSGVVQVSASLYRTCAVTTDGGAKCWGYNADGALGTGNQTGSSTPVNVSGLTIGVALIRAGANHTCALTQGGGVKCWGSNSNGQIGDSTVNTTRLTPVDVTGLAIGVVQISLGTFHSCAVTTGGSAKCWGSNGGGQVGDGGAPTNRLAPVDVTGLTAGVAQVRAGNTHTCALLASDGGVKCCGFNSSGQVGDGTLVNRFTPVFVSGLISGVVQLWDATLPPTDSMPPAASPTQSPSANSGGWNKTEVAVTWNWADNVGGSGIDTANCTTSSTSSGEGNPIALSATCKDLARNTGNASYPVKVDKTKPTISAAATTSPNTAGWYKNDVLVQFTCFDTGGSDVAPSGGCPAPETLSIEGASVPSTIKTAVDAAGNESDPSNVVTVKIDKSKPTISAAATTSPNTAGWYNGNVIVHFTCSDAGGSGIPTGACPADQTLNAEGAATASSATTVTDAAGNTSVSSNVVTVRIDKTAPTLSPVVSPNVVLLNGAATVASGAMDLLSGIAVQACGAMDTSTVGLKAVNCTATDNAGNTATVAVTYQVMYSWTGFFQPVDNMPTVNSVKAGSAIAVKFGLGGNQGLSIFATGYPVSRLIVCDSSAPLDEVELPTITAGGSGLTFDPASGQYSYVWKTDKSWALTCRQLVVKLVDGTEHVANFKLK